MAGLKKESLVWLDQLEVLNTHPDSTSRAELIRTLNVKNSHITNLRALKPCFDPKAVEKVRQAALATQPYTLSFNSALALAGLKNRVSDFPTAFHTALDLALSRRLSLRHIKALVQWMASGKPASEFDHTTVPRKGPHRSKRGPQTTSLSGTAKAGQSRTFTDEFLESQVRGEMKFKRWIASFILNEKECRCLSVSNGKISPDFWKRKAWIL
jgi:hypothetical protein